MTSKGATPKVEKAKKKEANENKESEERRIDCVSFLWRIWQFV